MAKLVALWSKPEEVDAFEKEYLDDHIPMARALEGVTSVTTNLVVSGDYYRIAELEFSSIESLGTSMGSDGGQRLRGHADAMCARYGVELAILVAD